MSKSGLVLLLSVFFLTTAAQAQRFIKDDFLKQLFRSAMPPDAQCVDDPGTGPNCTYKSDAGQITVGKTLDGAVSGSVKYPKVNQDAANLIDTLIKVADGFGFPDDQVHSCLRTSVNDFVARKQKPGYNSFWDGGWGPGVAETVTIKGFKLMCRAGMPDLYHIDFLISIDNSF
jgi:hypothetical protein